MQPALRPESEALALDVPMRRRQDLGPSALLCREIRRKLSKELAPASAAKAAIADSKSKLRGSGEVPPLGAPLFPSATGVTGVNSGAKDLEGDVSSSTPGEAGLAAPWKPRSAFVPRRLRGAFGSPGGGLAGERQLSGFAKGLLGERAAGHAAGLSAPCGRGQTTGLLEPVSAWNAGAAVTHTAGEAPRLVAKERAVAKEQAEAGDLGCTASDSGACSSRGAGLQERGLGSFALSSFSAAATCISVAACPAFPLDKERQRESTR